MEITCVSDLHGFYPKLEGGDLLIIAGDLTARDTDVEYYEVFHWISQQKYKKKIIIAGNHDNRICNHVHFPDHFEYLCDSGTEFEGLKIWGSPWTRSFVGMNPHCKAFTLDTEEELAKKWALIPDDVDILITHSPPYGILDKLKPRILPRINDMLHAGSKSLAEKIGLSKNPPKLWIWGHIHEAYGRDPVIRGKPCIMVNASIMNEDYDPINDPIRVILEKENE